MGTVWWAARARVCVVLAERERHRSVSCEAWVGVNLLFCFPSRFVFVTTLSHARPCRLNTLKKGNMPSSEVEEASASAGAAST